MSRTRLLFRKNSSAPNIITAQELALFARFILLLKLPEYPSSTLKPFRLNRSARFMASFVKSLLTGITEIGRSRKWVFPNKGLIVQLRRPNRYQVFRAHPFG